MEGITRRNFIKKTSLLTAGALISLTSPLPLSASTSQNKYYDFSKDSEQTLMAKLLCGEGAEIIASKDKREAIVIGYTAVNRAKDRIKRYGGNLKEVILKNRPRKTKKGKIIHVHQYSCFNSWDPNLKRIKNPQKYYPADVWKNALSLSSIILKNELPFLNNGQDHYHAKNMKRYPRWTKNPRMKKVWGQTPFEHEFYKDTRV